MEFILPLPFSTRNPTCNPTWSITHIAFIYIIYFQILSLKLPSQTSSVNQSELPLVLPRAGSLPSTSSTDISVTPSTGHRHAKIGSKKESPSSTETTLSMPAPSENQNGPPALSDMSLLESLLSLTLPHIQIPLTPFAHNFTPAQVFNGLHKNLVLFLSLTNVLDT